MQNRFAEVQYYFRFTINSVERGLAMVAPFHDPDQTILEETGGALLACTYRGDVARRVVAMSDISSVVAMIPLPLTTQEATRPDAQALRDNRYFVVEKLGLDIAYLGGALEPAPEFDPDDDRDFD